MSKAKHPNIVSVIDHGVSSIPKIDGPFYVMKRYSYSLRDIINSDLSPENALKIFSGILDGVEAAHFKGAYHRDLKPENVLIDKAEEAVAIADFGVASFNPEDVYTNVETKPGTRLANFRYAAPEQREPGKHIDHTSDIFALGLILNELFTRKVPQGTDYALINTVDENWGFLDEIVSKMIQQDKDKRPQSIAEIKRFIQKYRAESVALQKIREFDSAVVPEGEITDPLAYEPPKLIDAQWNNDELTLVLNQPISADWQKALRNMGNYRSVWNIPPSAFNFSGANARVSCQAGEAQQVTNYFKAWLPNATATLKNDLQQKLDREKEFQINQLAEERRREEERLKINQALTI